MSSLCVSVYVSVCVLTRVAVIRPLVVRIFLSVVSPDVSHQGNLPGQWIGQPPSPGGGGKSVDIPAENSPEQFPTDIPRSLLSARFTQMPAKGDSSWASYYNTSLVIIEVSSCLVDISYSALVQH